MPTIGAPWNNLAKATCPVLLGGDDTRRISRKAPGAVIRIGTLLPLPFPSVAGANPEFYKTRDASYCLAIRDKELFMEAPPTAAYPRREGPLP